MGEGNRGDREKTRDQGEGRGVEEKRKELSAKAAFPNIWSQDFKTIFKNY